MEQQQEQFPLPHWMKIIEELTKNKIAEANENEN